MKMKLSRINLLKLSKFKPHPAQIHILNNLTRFTVIQAGRRFGKNELLAYLELENFLSGKGLVWHVTPLYKLSKIGFNMILKLLRPIRQKYNIISRIDNSDMIIETVFGSVWEGKSADNPTSLLGNGPKYMGIDEAARIPPSIWNEALRPSLMDSKGEATFISTPRGKTWFSDIGMMGQDPEAKEYSYFHYTTYDNPHIDKAEIDSAKTQMSDITFRQEIMAETIPDAGVVFRNIESCAISQIEEPQEGKSYIFSADLAKYNDFTVIMVADVETKRVIYFDRFNELSLQIQRDRILSIARKYNNASGIVDATGIGDAIFEELKQSGIKVEPFIFTEPSKNNLIENLAVSLENGEIFYPNIPEILNELFSFEYIISTSRKFRYNAPTGLHDDCVIALALINKKLLIKPFVFGFIGKNEIQSTFH